MNKDWEALSMHWEAKGRQLEAQAVKDLARNVELEAVNKALTEQLAEMTRNNVRLHEKFSPLETENETLKAEAGKYRTLAKKLWPAMNARRCNLITLKQFLTPSEASELAGLQALADEYMNTMAPLPIAELEAYAAALQEGPDATEPLREHPKSCVAGSLGASIILRDGTQVCLVRGENAHNAHVWLAVRDAKGVYLSAPAALQPVEKEGE